MQNLGNFSILVRQLAQHAPSTTKQSASVHFSSCYSIKKNLSGMFWKWVFEEARQLEVKLCIPSQVILLSTTSSYVWIKQTATIQQAAIHKCNHCLIMMAHLSVFMTVNYTATKVMTIVIQNVLQITTIFYQTSS